MSESSGAGGDHPSQDAEPTVEEPHPRPGSRPSHAAPERIGPYRILEKVGEGGWGVVYVAEQQQPVRRRVAVKVIKLGMDTATVVARFEAERQALAMMDHPNIARVLDAGATEAGRPYFVMELVRGIRITDYCDQNRLGTRERIELFVKVCHAIQHAHQKGIIHRDIKPSNVLVTMHDGEPVPKVIDFGIAKATDTKLTDKTIYTQLHQFIGTPAYMSPEQAEMSGLDIDTRSDIYSLGVLLYELFTGRLPFDAEELAKAGMDAMRRSIRDREPPRPSTRLAQLSGEDLTTAAQRRSAAPPRLIHLLRGDLDWVVMKCLEKDRTRRYETASGLAADLRRHLNDEPVTARPPSAAYRLRKSIRRNAVAFATTAVVILTLVVAAAVSSWQAVKATRAGAAAKIDRDNAKHSAEQASFQQSRAEAEARTVKIERDRADNEARAARHSAYAAKMLLARTDWDRSNMKRLRQTIAETRDYADRGFEWYYWNRLCHLELLTFRFYDSDVSLGLFSPDGEMLACANGRDLHIYDARTAREIRTWRAHAGSTTGGLAWCGSKRIVSGSDDHTAKVWDVTSGRLLQTLRGHVGALTWTSASSDGRFVGTASYDGTARVWNASTGDQILCVREEGALCWAVVFSPDCQRVATCGSDKVVRVYELPSGRKLLSLEGHTQDAQGIAFTPDGTRLLSYGDDHLVMIWDTATGRPLMTYRGHSDSVWNVAVTPDSKRALSGSRDGTIKLWDVGTGREALDIRGPSGAIYTTDFSPDGQRFVTGNTDGSVRVWDMAREPECRSLPHSAGVNAVVFSPDNQKLATATNDGKITLWDAAEGRLLQAITNPGGAVTALRFSPDGRQIASGGEDGAIRFWELSAGRERLTIPGQGDTVWSLAFSPDGSNLVSGGEDRTVRLWDTATGHQLVALGGHEDGIRGIAYSSDGHLIASCAIDRTVRLWDAASRREVKTFSGTKPFMGVDISPDGSSVVAGAWDGTVTVWDVASAKERISLPGRGSGGYGSPLSVFTPDGGRLIATFSGNVIVLDVASGEDMLALPGVRKKLSSLAMSPDGTRLACGGGDGTVQLWTAASLMQTAGWEREQNADAARWSVEQAKRLKASEDLQKSLQSDEGAIKSWLVLAPLPWAPGDTHDSALRAERLQGEGALHPRDGARVEFKGTELSWKPWRSDDAVLDFGRFLGRTPTNSLGYAACYVIAPEARHDLLMKTGSDDSGRIYLNGEVVHEFPKARGFQFDEDTVAGIELRAGTNVVVFKIVNGTGGWKGSLRFTEEDGRPVKGLKVTLDPGETH